MNQYICYGCSKTYDDEELAIKCCTEPIESNDGDYYLPAKTPNRKPVSRTHNCPNVNLGGKTWSVWLNPDEQCPACNYIWQPR